MELGVWAVFVIVVAIHLLSFLPFIDLRLGDALVPVIFLPIITFVLAMMRTFQASWSLYVLIDSGPRWLGRGFYLSGAYSLVTFVIGAENYHGQPTVTPSGFALMEDGRVLRTISESEYWQAARADVASLFGFLVLFAYWGAAGYTLASRRIAAEPPPAEPLSCYAVPAVKAGGEGQSGEAGQVTAGGQGGQGGG
ncbi:MAG TPA: hypothetical protein VJN18_05640 [Polyangiaceae bacterium]|nr:hypothetical protein [Polyangiaceae bacterium]